MKKGLILVLIASIMVSAVGIWAVYANNQTENNTQTNSITGLQEKMDALWLTNVVDQETQDRMLQNALDSFNAGWPQWLETTKMLGKMEGKTDEEMYEYQWNYVKPKFENGLLVTCLNTVEQNSSYRFLDTYRFKYMLQYAQQNKFRYLFSSNRYWSTNNSGGNFLEDGTYFSNSKTVFGHSIPQFIILDEARIFLKNVSNLETLLLQRGESIVSDVKLFTLDNSVVLLYIQCGDNEYFIRLLKSDYIPQIEQFKLYSVSEVINLISEFFSSKAENSQAYEELTESINSTKPTYQTEAEALEAEGLLKGNENGLDLLKPLTRIEAAAMLLRAMGETETAPPNSGQVFTDVPQSHWGFGAATNAYDLGIVNGVGNNQFAPDNLVTATEFSTMVLRAADTGEFDWQQATNLLIEQGVITAEEVETMDLFTRGDMAKMIYEAREKGLLQ